MALPIIPAAYQISVYGPDGTSLGADSRARVRHARPGLEDAGGKNLDRAAELKQPIKNVNTAIAELPGKDAAQAEQRKLVAYRATLIAQYGDELQRARKTEHVYRRRRGAAAVIDRLMAAVYSRAGGGPLRPAKLRERMVTNIASQLAREASAYLGHVTVTESLRSAVKAAFQVHQGVENWLDEAGRESTRNSGIVVYPPPRPGRPRRKDIPPHVEYAVFRERGLYDQLVAMLQEISAAPQPADVPAVDARFNSILAAAPEPEIRALKARLTEAPIAKAFITKLAPHRVARDVVATLLHVSPGTITRRLEENGFLRPGTLTPGQRKAAPTR